MVGFEREWQMMKQDIAILKTGLAEIQQQLRSASAAGQTQRDNRPLSMEHIMQLYTLARALESQTGQPVSALFRELAEVFDVTDVSTIPDAGWEHVWFWQKTPTNCLLFESDEEGASFPPCYNTQQYRAAAHAARYHRLALDGESKPQREKGSYGASIHTGCDDACQ